MADTDTEAKLIAEMTALVRRAVALGHKLGSKETADRIFRAAAGEATVSSVSQTPEPPQASPEEERETGQKRRYPYGYVSSAIEQTLKDHPSGINRDRVSRYCRETLEKDIDDDAIRNALKQAIRKKRAYRRGNKLFWSDGSDLLG